MRRTTLAPAALAVLFAIGPVGCNRRGAGGGRWADPPPAFTPEPPSPLTVAGTWDASAPPPRPPVPGALPTDRTARKPRQVIGDRRFYCPLASGQPAVSPDGRLLACGGGDPYTVYLFDAASGREVGRLYGHTPARPGLAFSPDSKRLYGPGAVWDVAARRGLARPPMPNWDLTADGRLLVTVESEDVPWAGPPNGPRPGLAVTRAVVRIRDTRTWDEVEAFAATGMGPAVAVSPDGRYVALGGAGGVVRVWDRRDRTELPPLPALSEKPPGDPAHARAEVTRLVFSPDGKTLAGASGGTHLVSGLRHVALWHWPAGALAHKLPLSNYDPWTLAFTPDGRHLVATATVRSVVWDVATGAVRGEREQHRHGSSYGPVAVAPDGRRVYTLGAGSLVTVSLPDLTPVAPDPRLPDTPPKPPFETYRHPAPTGPDGPGWRLPDGTRIRQGGITRSDETFGVLHLDAGGGRIRYYLERNVVGFDVTADGKLLATYGHDDTPGRGRELPLQFWDLATGAELAAVPVRPPLPHSYRLRFSPDGKRLAMVHGRDLVRVYDVAGRAPVLSLDADGVAVSELTYSADGRFLVGSRGSGPAVVWDATGGE